jgi:ribosomal protein S4
MANKVNASRFCLRRLPLVMVRNNMSQTIQAAIKFIEQGHVRVGPERCTDPAFLVSRAMEDYVTWTDTSAIRRQIESYNGMVRGMVLLVQFNFEALLGLIFLYLRSKILTADIFEINKVKKQLLLFLRNRKAHRKFKFFSPTLSPAPSCSCF